MREALKDPGRLQHILDAIYEIESNRQKYSDNEILCDTIIFYGFTKLLEIIGEAAYMLTKEFKDKHRHIPWEQIEGMRHVLVHGYYTIDPSLVVKTIEQDLPPLKNQIIEILDNL
ncbi:MAG: DUF86 domain-containing protein [Bacteroides sp.]|nr:DUF86 domain-containing protein [Bacteroides sp.]MCM1457233.1 DUF86 domain-containing protein [Lachnoclostridium sp.]